MKKSIKIALISVLVLALLVFLLFFAPKPVRIIFRIIIGLLLLVILAVLLCPIGYSADAGFDGKPDVHALIKWMGFIKVPVDYNEQGVKFAVKLFGFQLVPKKGKGGGEEDEMKDDTSEEKTGKSEDKSDSATENAETSGKNEKSSEKPESDKKDGDSENTKESEKEAGTGKGTEKDGESDKDSGKDGEEDENDKQPFLDKLEDKIDKFIGIWDNTMCALNDEEIQLNLFLKRKSTKHSLEWTKQFLLDLGNHVRPRKLKGELEFGLDDPSTTGYISAVASLYYDIYSDSFDFLPNFEEKVIKGRVNFSGRFVLGYILIKCVWLYLGRPFKYLFSKFGFFKTEPYGGREFRMFIKNALALKNTTMKNIAKIKDGVTNYG